MWKPDARPRLTAALAGSFALLLTVPGSWLASAPPALARPADQVIPRLASPPGARQPAPPPPERRLVLPPGVRQVCAAPGPGQMACLALLRTNVRAGKTGPLNTSNAYGPAALQSAYNLAAASATKGTGETVAVVDAFNDPDAASDLAIYRHKWALPACDPATGAGCVTKIDQGGHAAPLPGVDPTGGWELEESLDLDMVSAICPRCHILLVEAKSAAMRALAQAENTAVRLGAKFVTNSWGNVDQPGAWNAYGRAFDHPGVAITAAAGDFEDETYFPASSQLVTSVGGTTLTRAAYTKRGWRETVWSSPAGSNAGTSSGCARNGVTDAQPPWQQAFAKTHPACPNRVDNDVAAVANPGTPVWAYDTVRYYGNILGWTGLGGTSAASPIIAAVYALAGTPAAGSYPASYLYQKGHAADLYDVTKGSTGSCTPAILCTAGRGYDGPTGWGTPDGTAAFTSTQRGNTVTVISPGTSDYPVDTTIKLKIQATDTGTSHALHYSAAGLPAGVSIGAASGVISGRLPATSTADEVTVMATDHTGTHGTVTFPLDTIANLQAAYHPAPGPIEVVTAINGPDKCLQTPPGSRAAATAAKVVIWSCDGKRAQAWTFEPDVQASNAGTLTIDGRCLTVAASRATELAPCTPSGRQQWSLFEGASWIYNVATGECLNDPRDSMVNGTQADVSACVSFEFRELFLLPPAPIMSGVSGLCLTDPGDSKVSGTPAEVLPCNGGAAQIWNTFSNDGGPTLPGGLFLDASSAKPGAPVTLDGPGSGGGYSLWFPLLDGEIYNEFAGLCLDDPGGGGSGTKLQLARCTGQLGEIWAVT